ncbi:MAG TPA: glycosyltransferase [Steroidobacter sp.]
MSEANLRQVRVLHLVSSGALAPGLQQSLFMPLLTRTPKDRVKSQVVCLAPNVVPAAVLRQNGIPVHEVPLSRKRFSLGGFSELARAAKNFRPDLIQAWGHTAQILSVGVRKKCDPKPKLVWSVAHTAPLAKNAGFIDKHKLKWAARYASLTDRIVYASHAAASYHRRAGFPEEGHSVIPPGVDAVRFKPDPAHRAKVREKLGLDAGAFVLGMVAPFQPEYDHATFLKAVSELVKTQPNLAVILAGHGVQKGNAPLMALLGSGALGTRTHLLGEWSDLSALFNACDVVCSSALNDGARMTLAMAMLCGVPCVATGMGAQGEVIGQYGVAIEPGSPSAFVKGITRILQLPTEKRAAMAQGARKHALKNYVYVRSLQSYLQLYYDLIGRQTLAVEDVPVPRVDPDAPPPFAVTQDAPAKKKEPQKLAELTDPDSLETKVVEHSEPLPKWRLEQEEKRQREERELSKQIAAQDDSADVLAKFEAELAKPTAQPLSPMSERARGVAEEVEELLPLEVLATPVDALTREPTAAASAESPKKEAAKPEAPTLELEKESEPVSSELSPPEQLALIEPATPGEPAASIQLELIPDEESREPRKAASG